MKKELNKDESCLKKTHSKTSEEYSIWAPKRKLTTK